MWAGEKKTISLSETSSRKQECELFHQQGRKKKKFARKEITGGKKNQFVNINLHLNQL